MVLRPSSSAWSLSPQTILSHHYRLTKGVKGVVDTSPPFSMHNSPISVHYIPKRASSADAARRNQYRKPSKPQRELSDFVAAHSTVLKLPLPLRDDLLVKPKLLGNRNYQAPLHRKKDGKPPLPVPQKSPQPPPRSFDSKSREPGRQRRRQSREEWDEFVDTVYTLIIQRGVFTDSMIADTVEEEMGKWAGRLNWSELEMLRERIFDEFSVRSDIIDRQRAKIERRSSNSVDSSAGSTSSSSSSSSSQSRSGSKKSSSHEGSQRTSSSSSTSEASTSETSSRSSTVSDDTLSSIRD